MSRAITSVEPVLQVGRLTFSKDPRPQPSPSQTQCLRVDPGMGQASLGKEKLQIKWKVNKPGYDPCVLPQVCVSAQGQVRVPSACGYECVGEYVSGHVIVCICL